MASPKEKQPVNPQGACFTAPQAAAFLNISYDLFQEIERAGYVEPYRLPLSKRNRYRREDLERLLLPANAAPPVPDTPGLNRPKETPR